MDLLAHWEERRHLVALERLHSEQAPWVERLHLEELHLMVQVRRWGDLVTVVAPLWEEWGDHPHLVAHPRLVAHLMAHLMAQAPH